MSETFDVVVVGAGIVGAACAEECARGGLKALVLDQGPIAGGATGAAMGHLVVMDDSDAQFELTAYSRRLWQQRAGELPADVEYEPCGTLWVAADDEEMTSLRRKETYYRGHGVEVEVLDAVALAEAEPNLRGGLVGGLRVPGDAVLYPPRAAHFLLEQARSLGAEVRPFTPVRQIGGDGVVLLANGARIHAGACVNAAGCGSPALEPDLPVRKRKGHLVVTDRYPRFVRHQIIELGYLKSAHAMARESVAFNIQPRKTGQMLVGSSRQFDVEDTAIDYPVLGAMIRRAAHYLPSLGRLSALRAWAGHRPATPDKLPIIGPSPAGHRRWTATGHEGLGITTSLATGRLLADTLLHRTTEIPAGPYRPARLAKGETPHA